jgi:hypothetical protein
MTPNCSAGMTGLKRARNRRYHVLPPRGGGRETLPSAGRSASGICRYRVTKAELRFGAHPHQGPQQPPSSA